MINDRQFRMHRSGRGPDELDEGETGVSGYTVSHADPDAPGRATRHGRVDVLHYSTAPTSIQGWNEMRYMEDLAQPPAMGRETDRSYPDIPMYGKSDGQQMLFREQYGSKTPGKSVVEGMYFTKEARAMALPALAVAARDTAERFGRSLTPSDDRSMHSERLVSRLAERGAIEGNQRKHVNTLDFEPPTSVKDRNLGEELPGALAQGRQMARALLRQTRPRRDRSVQEPLF